MNRLFFGHYSSRGTPARGMMQRERDPASTTRPHPHPTPPPPGARPARHSRLLPRPRAPWRAPAPRDRDRAARWWSPPPSHRHTPRRDDAPPPTPRLTHGASAERLVLRAGVRRLGG